MERYRSGHNGPDSKSGVPLRVPWVRIPPAPPDGALPHRRACHLAGPLRFINLALIALQSVLSFFIILKIEGRL